MPEYAFAIDQYAEANEQAHVHLQVQEYAAPAEIELEAVRRRRNEVLASLPSVTGVPSERIHVRLRQRQSGEAQYTRQRADSPDPSPMLPVQEAGLTFLVNLDDYLDTGLFLDHRLTRARVRAAAGGGRFLNLFCYTATASVYAAAGGARSTLSLDLSNRYLDWAAENFKLNGLAPAAHRLQRVDCLEWLREAVDGGPAAGPAAAVRFDLIFLDPPTFSNSKRMQEVLDVQRDHALLVGQCMQLLAPHGLLLFSTNAQRFKFDPALAEQFAVKDISAATLPFDFARNPRIHRCYEIRAR